MQSKPALQQITVRCFKLRSLIPITEELFNDVTMLSNYLGSKLPQKFTYALNDVIVHGTGVGQPLGLLNSTEEKVDLAVDVAKRGVTA